MKNAIKILITLIICLPAFAVAQNEEQMKHMMQQAQKAQACMTNIDRDKLEIMGRKAKQVEAEVKSLCGAGQREEAQRKGMAFALEMSQSDVAQEMKKCSAMMAGAMGSSFMPGMSMSELQKTSGGQICDAY